MPHMLARRDVLAQSQTGTGKTARSHYHCLAKSIYPSELHKYCLAPTRELAIQVARSFEKYATNLDDLRVAAIYGGKITKSSFVH